MSRVLTVALMSCCRLAPDHVERPWSGQGSSGSSHGLGDEDRQAVAETNVGKDFDAGATIDETRTND
jgi:hypothetical protein